MRIFLLIVLMLSFSVNGATQLTIWHMSKELDTDYKAIAARYSAINDDVNVTVHFFPNEELKSSALRAFNQHSSPDIIIFSSDNVGYADVMRLSVLPADMIAPTMPAAVKDALQYRNKHFSVPLFAGNHLLMFYNKALVDKPASDWHQLMAQHPTLKAKGVKTLALNYQEPYWFALFASLFGATLVDSNSDNATLNTPAMQQALIFYQQLATTGVVNGQCNYRCVSEDFFNGDYAYAVNGTWALAEAKERLGTNLGITLFPQLDGRHIAPLASYIVMVFPNNALSSEKSNHIKHLVDFFRQPEHLAPIAQRHYLIPYYQSYTAINTDQPSDIQVDAKINEQRRFTQLMPASAAMVSVWNGMQKGMMLYRNNTLDAAAAAELMQRVSTRDQRLLKTDVQ